jgi:hypothetical protein
VLFRSLDRPGGHLWLVGDEEVVQVPADEPAAGRLLHDDIDDVFAVEPTFVSEEHLLAEVAPRLIQFGFKYLF